MRKRSLLPAEPWPEFDGNVPAFVAALIALKRDEVIAARGAKNESVKSNLPGRENGPADAYRHLLWLAELTRLYGTDIARLAGQLHEATDRGASAAVRAMDLHNNETGIAIGRQARSWDDVIRASRKVIEDSPKDGAGGPGTARWLPQGDWKNEPRSVRNWPEIDWERNRDPDQHVIHPYADMPGADRGSSDGTMEMEGWPAAREQELVFRHSDPANGGRASMTFGGRLRDPALDRWLAERRATDRIDRGGTVHVAAHTRVLDGRPVPVGAHTRAPPSSLRRWPSPAPAAAAGSRHALRGPR